MLTACAGDGGGLKPEDSPLRQYLSAALGGDLSEEEQNRRFEEQRKKEEELVAKCMAKEGFEYKTRTANVAAYGEEGDWEPESKAWVEKYGYGAVTSLWAERDAEARQSGKNPADPNADYLASLSESERNTYQETLYGKMPDPSQMGEDGSFEYRWENAGCRGAAEHEAAANDPWQKDEFKGLRDRMQKLWESMQSSSEMKELDGKWASCMADAGESGFTRQSDASESIYDALMKIDNGTASQGGTDSSEPSASPAPQDKADVAKSPEMKELGKKEIALALKDLSCREKTSYRDGQMKIQFALEEKFIAENKAELDAFKAAAEQSK